MRQTYLRIKAIAVLMLLVLSAPAYAQSLQYQFNHLSQKQITVLKQSCRFGIKDNLCYSLIAISWQESNFGVWIVNYQDKGAGWFGVKISSAIKRITPKMRMTRFNLNRVGSWLINDSAFSARMAIAELKFWYRVRKGNWMRVWESYNAGYGRNKRYARDIADKVKFLQRHVKF